MTTLDVGKLSETATHKAGAVNLDNSQDVYKFTVSEKGINHSGFHLNASIHDARSGARGLDSTITPIFRIFKDSNNDGIFEDSGAKADKFVSSVDSNSIFNEGPINTSVFNGNYFAVVDRPSALLAVNDPTSISYQMDLSVTPRKSPSNLVPVKLPFGTLGVQKKTTSGGIDDGNTSDVYSVNIDPKAGSIGAEIILDGLSADADIRVLKDGNGDRVFQDNELVVDSKNSGSTSEKFFVDRGDYLIQVYQFSGSTGYNLTVNPFLPLPNINGFGFVGGNLSKPLRFAASTGGMLKGNNAGGILVGGVGNDKLLGNGGADEIYGGNGNDILYGGQGNDTLSGGQGNDIFVLAPHNGFDIVKDFGKGDLLGLASSLQFQDLTLVNQAKGMVVKAGNEKLAFLQGVHELPSSDFTQINLGNLNSRVHNDFAALTKA